MIAEEDSTNFVLIEAKALAKAMKIANAIIEPRITIPILNTVKLSYGANGLTIDATDLDISVSLTADEIDGNGEWECCVPSRHLIDIAAAAGVTPIRIEPNSTMISGESKQRTEYLVGIQAGEASYNLQALDPGDYPKIHGDRAQRIDKFTNGRFASMLDKVQFCVSTEETRYYLNGVNWSAKQQGMRLAATDGHRLAVYRYDDNEAAADFSYIIPRKTVSILTQFLAGADVEVFSVALGNQVLETILDIRSPGIEIRTKTIDGTYPDFDRVIPKSGEHKLDTQREELLAAIRQATAIGGGRGQAVRLHGVDGRLGVELKNPETGTAKVSTSSIWPEGLEAFGVNHKYLTQMVKTCHGQITFAVEQSGHPITLTDDDEGMTRVVMPMRV